MLNGPRMMVLLIKVAAIVSDLVPPLLSVNAVSKSKSFGHVRLPTPGMTTAPLAIVPPAAESPWKPRKSAVMPVVLFTVQRKLPYLLPSLMKRLHLVFIHVVSPTVTATVEPTAGITKLAVVAVIAEVPLLPGVLTVTVSEQQGMHGAVALIGSFKVDFLPTQTASNISA